MQETTAEQQKQKKSSVRSREPSDELEKRGVEASSNIPNSDSAAGRYSDLKRQFMNELGLGQYYEIQVRDNATFNRLLESRIEQQRKEVEEQRDRNLTTLSVVLDKCIKSDKITGDLIERILDLVGIPRHGDKPVEPCSKRRRLTSPMTSPKGRSRILSDATALASKDAQGFVAPVQNVQGTYPMLYHGGAGPAPWLPQQFNKPLPPQNQYQSSFPAGLGMSVTRSREPSMAQNNENQPGVRPGSYSPVHIAPVSNPGSSALPSTGPTGRASLMTMHPESPQKAPANFLLPSHQAQSQYRMKTEPVSQRKTAGHRRSQSATVLPNASGSGSVRSPVRELQASPQRPVNFLIHTPKHPPPT
ncbi:hypothetical protein HG536_0B02980 [Torulaspora globosa]|uniref:Uncharacterized protein n=1 Tax=Torulaspora globosa TaxID=48254 RepID=A0A7G3ZD49_9SACH|nr:uncharacterized protein HG536_0B02980 [Torulaspora globosa]QLL31435.1 hypothetical protein HG536_0B02980 [Torulaspora globosa]